jgi:ABC-type branched-subunit amino acid transport system substrate-binding protein
VKKSFSLIAAIVLITALVLSACGGSSPTSGGNQGASTPEKSGEKSGETAKSDDTSNGGGKTNVQGVTDTEILVGNWAPQTGPAAQYGVVANGIQAYFDKVNSEGGVNGRQLKLITYDDEYQPSKTVGFAKKLIEEDKVYAIIGAVCTNCNKAAKPQVEKSGIPLFPSTGASLFADPPIKNYFPLITNYGIEARIFVDYAVDTLHAKTGAIFYQNDDFGKDGYQAALEEAKKKGLEIVAEVPYNTTDVDFSPYAQKIKQANADVIFGFTVPKPGAAFWKEVAKIGAKKPFFSTYVTGADTVMYDLAGKDAWEGTYSTTFMPSTEETDDPKVAEFIEWYKKKNSDAPSGFAEWGWAYAQVFTEIVKRCGDDLSWENFYKQAETLQDWDGGLPFKVTYSPTNRYGQTTVYMIQAKGGKLEKVSDPITYEVK